MGSDVFPFKIVLNPYFHSLNGKGDKPRFVWSEKDRERYKKIFKPKPKKEKDDKKRIND